MFKGLLQHIGLIWLFRHPGTGLNISKTFFIYLIALYDISLIIYDSIEGALDINTIISMAIINAILYLFYTLKPEGKKSGPTALLLVFLSASFIRFILSPVGFISMLLFVWELAAIFKVTVTIKEKNLG